MNPVIRIYVRDLVVRALHTFWQAFVATLGVVWVASGIDVSQIVDMASAKKVALAAVAAVAAAALSALKTTIAQLASTRNVPPPEDGHGSTHPMPGHVAEHAA